MGKYYNFIARMTSEVKGWVYANDIVEAGNKIYNLQFGSLEDEDIVSIDDIIELEFDGDEDD